VALIAVLLVLLSYFYGCFSTARIIARSFRSLNIYKVGSGFADTENIYLNISKPLGLLTGVLDLAKSYAYLFFLKRLLLFMDKMALPPDLSLLYADNMFFIYGVAMLIGHCLPLTNRLRGGRGIFTYIGFVLFLAPYPMLATLALAAVLVFGFGQIRFSQYTVVLLPVLLTVLLSALHPYLPFLHLHYMTAAFSAKLLGLAVVMGLLNYLVSKKLGEF